MSPATATAAAQINTITGVSGALASNDYSDGLAQGTFADSSSPTAAEIQAVVDSVNSANGLAAVAGDIAGSSGGAAATAAQINAITGVSGAVDGADYSVGLKQGTFVDKSSPTAAEIQVVVDAANVLNAVVEDIAGNTDGIVATAAQINTVAGVAGAVDGADYSAGLARGTFADRSSPTAAEIQAVIDAANVLNAAVEDIAGNTDGVAAIGKQKKLTRRRRGCDTNRNRYNNRPGGVYTTASCGSTSCAHEGRGPNYFAGLTILFSLLLAVH